MSSILKHKFSTEAPTAAELKIGELALQISNNSAKLFTKDISGEVIELGKSVLNFGELEDVDFTELEEEAFLIRQGNVFKFSKQIGSIGSLSDIELSSPTQGEYLRYDPSFLTFRNFTPSYYLFELLDTNIPDSRQGNAAEMNDKTIYYNHSSGKFELRVRRNLLNQLDDVEITSEDTSQLLQLDSDGIWKNKPLSIVKDPAPTLGGDLNANGFSILDSVYKNNVIVADAPIKTLNYSDGDYWVIQGVSSTVSPQCVININFTSAKQNALAVLMLEIRQDTNNIVLSGLENIKYEDGKSIRFSGAGKTDLVTILIEKIGNVYTSYITMTAANIAAIGEGGLPSYRYDKNRYVDTQLFANPYLYDDWFDYVQLLLNFEQELSTNRLWYEDKSNYHHTVSTTATQVATDLYTYGLREYAADHATSLITTTVTTSTDILLDGDFTLEMYLNHPLENQYINTSIDHVLFDNQDSTLRLRYVANIDTQQDSYIEVKIHDNLYVYPNAYNYFLNKQNRYVHIALVRDVSSSTVSLYVDGYKQTPLETLGVISRLNTVTVESATINGFVGLLNSLRLTSISRYSSSYQNPNMRFGLTGGANDVLEAQVFDLYRYLDKELEIDIFC